MLTDEAPGKFLRNAAHPASVRTRDTHNHVTRPHCTATCFYRPRSIHIGDVVGPQNHAIAAKTGGPDEGCADIANSLRPSSWPTCAKGCQVPYLNLWTFLGDVRYHGTTPLTDQVGQPPLLLDESVDASGLGVEIVAGSSLHSQSGHRQRQLRESVPPSEVGPTLSYPSGKRTRKTGDRLRSHRIREEPRVNLLHRLTHVTKTELMAPSESETPTEPRRMSSP